MNLEFKRQFAKAFIPSSVFKTINFQCPIESCQVEPKEESNGEKTGKEEEKEGRIKTCQVEVMLMALCQGQLCFTLIFSIYIHKGLIVYSIPYRTLKII